MMWINALPSGRKHRRQVLQQLREISNVTENSYGDNLVKFI